MRMNVHIKGLRLRVDFNGLFMAAGLLLPPSREMSRSERELGCRTGGHGRPPRLTKTGMSAETAMTAFASTTCAARPPFR